MPLSLHVFADLVCPWCYIGEQSLERAIATIEDERDVAVQRHWQPFQLRPDMPAEGRDWRAFAEEKFGGWKQAQQAFAQVERAGADYDLDFDFAAIASAPNTTDAHRLVLYAAGALDETPDDEAPDADDGPGGDAIAHALFRAYFAEGRDIGRRDVLVDLAAAHGLDADAVEAVLASDAGQEPVRRSQEQAARLGVRGVPFVVVGGTHGVSGAQPPGAFVRAMRKALDDGDSGEGGRG